MYKSLQKCVKDLCILVFLCYSFFVKSRCFSSIYFFFSPFLTGDVEDWLAVLTSSHDLRSLNILAKKIFLGLIFTKNRNLLVFHFWFSNSSTIMVPMHFANFTYGSGSVKGSKHQLPRCQLLKNRTRWMPFYRHVLFKIDFLWHRFWLGGFVRTNMNMFLRWNVQIQILVDLISC